MPANHGQGLPFIQQLQPRMSAAASKLGVLLAQALQAVLAREVPSARQHCLHAYAAVGDFTGAEQVCRLTSCVRVSCTSWTGAAWGLPARNMQGCNFHLSLQRCCLVSSSLQHWGQCWGWEACLKLALMCQTIEAHQKLQCCRVQHCH